MFFKSIKVWLLLGIGIEIGLDLVAGMYNYDILQLEIVKLAIYIICYVVLNVFLVKKKLDEKDVLGINCGVNTALASLMGAISFTIVVKSRDGIGWILFLLSYIGAIMLCFMISKKSEVSDEKKEQKINSGAIRVLGAGSALFSISFVRTASEDMRKIVYIILYLVILWLFCL